MRSHVPTPNGYSIAIPLKASWCGGTQTRGWSVILPASDAAMTQSDAEAIHAVLHGDVERYAELVDKHQEQAIRIAFSFLGNHEDARDVSQEAFVSAYHALGRFRGGAKFSTWLYRIVVNACKDLLRRRQRQPVIIAGIGEPEAGEQDGRLFVDVNDPAAGPRERAEQQELALKLSWAIGELSTNQRTAFLLHHVHGLPVAEVAGVMHCRTGTVKSHLFRASETLRKQLTPWLVQEGLS